MNQIAPQTALQPSQLNYLTPVNFQNQAKLAYLANLQYLCNINIANNLQNAQQALTSCANEYSNLANNAPNTLQGQPWMLQQLAAKNALTQCQNQYESLVNQEIPQAHLNYNQLQTSCNNLQSALKPKGFNLANLTTEAQNQCSTALAVTIDITAIIETNVHTTTNVHTSGTPGSGPAQVETHVGATVEASQPQVASLKKGSFLKQ
jgi:hypothetical protein